MSDSIQQQLTMVNARVHNVNLALGDLLRDLNTLVKVYTDKIAELEAKPKETPKTK